MGPPTDSTNTKPPFIFFFSLPSEHKGIILQYKIILEIIVSAFEESTGVHNESRKKKAQQKS